MTREENIYPNLNAEMARGYVDAKTLARRLDYPYDIVADMLSGRRPITLSEAHAIKSVLFTKEPLENLFSTVAIV